MTRSEMLKQMELTDEELKRSFTEVGGLSRSLNKHQRAVFDTIVPTPTRSSCNIRSVIVTAEELQELFGRGIRLVLGAFTHRTDGLSKEQVDATRRRG